MVSTVALKKCPIWQQNAPYPGQLNVWSTRTKHLWGQKAPGGRGLQKAVECRGAKKRGDVFCIFRGSILNVGGCCT